MPPLVLSLEFHKMIASCKKSYVFTALYINVLVMDVKEALQCLLLLCKAP